MQDKHIDELMGVIKTQAQGYRQYGTFYGSSIKSKLQKLITTEQLAIWNKALELVGEDIGEKYYSGRELTDIEGNNKSLMIQDTTKEERRVNEFKAELRSAIQQQIKELKK